MMIDHRLRIIRFWYAAAVAFSMALYSLLQSSPLIAGLTLLPLGIMVGALPACSLYSDTFTTDLLAGMWTAVSGSWSVGSGVLTTSSAGAVLIANQDTPTGHGYVTCEVKTDTSATTLSLFGAYVDDDNYLELRLTVDDSAGSVVRLFKVEAGSTTQLSPDVTASSSTGTFDSLALCWDGSYATGLFEGGVVWTSAYSGTGGFAGVGASPGAGTATFDNFDFQRHQIDDSRCLRCAIFSCSTCVTGEAPAAISAVVVGLTNGFGCSSCSSYNGTFIYTNTGASSPCVFVHTFASNPCGHGQSSIQLFSSGDGNPVGVTHSFNTANFGREKVNPGWGDDPLDCLTLSETLDGDKFAVGAAACTVPNNGTNDWSYDAIGGA